MFKITGELNGELVDDKRVSAKQLIEKFNLPIPTDGKGSVRFELTPKSMKVKNGQRRFAVSRQMNPLIQATYNGESYFIRYYQREVKNPGKDGGYRYFPTRVSMTGMVETLSIPEDLEKAVLLCLNPACKDSPFNDSRKTAAYQIVDLQAKAKEQFDIAQAQEAARQFLLKSNDENKIMYIAKGLVLPGGQTISDTKLGSTIEARMALIEESKKHSQLVANAITDPVVLVRGMMRRSVEQGYVIPSKAGGGRTQWRWKDGSPICITEGNSDALTGLIRFCVDPNNLAGIKSRVNDFIGETSIEGAAEALKASGAASIVTHDINLDDKAAVLMRMFEEDLIWLNRENLKVYVLVDGEPENRSIGSVTKKEGWIQEFADKITPPQWGRCKKIIKKFLEIE